MERILVTTDLLESSKAAIQFAIQLSQQRHIELIFFHADKLWEERGWTEATERKEVLIKKQRLQKKMEAFVLKEYAAMGILSSSYKCVIHYKYGVINSVLEYAANYNCDYICITAGRGEAFARYFGTTVGNVIMESEIPVFCIPQDYVPEDLTNLLYASDMNDYKTELEIVIQFAKPSGLKVDMVHFEEEGMKLDTMIEDLKNVLQYPVRSGSLQFLSGSVIKSLEEIASTLKPSVVVMFTNQNRSFFEMIFGLSLAREFSIRSKVPLLVYYKPET